jgi:hypothetical protein
MLPAPAAAGLLGGYWPLQSRSRGEIETAAGNGGLGWGCEPALMLHKYERR